MRQINLLPSEIKPSKQFGIAVKKAAKNLVVFFIIYLFLLSASIGLVYYFNGKIKELAETKANLSAQIKSLSNIETSTINIRDRVVKLERIQGRDLENVGLMNLGEL